MSKIKAVVFDMDGVILDSRELVYRAMEDVLLVHGVQNITREDMAGVTGKPIHAMYELLVPHLDAYELEREHLTHHDKNMHLLQAYPGVRETLDGLRRSYALGLFTGFNELTYDRLRLFDLQPYFKSIVETTRYTNHKPHPEGLLLCMQELGVSAGETVYVGDGVSDMLAGKAANVRATVGITQGFGSREALLEAGADHMINALAELPPLLEAIA